MTTPDLLTFINDYINKANAFPVSSIGGITVMVTAPVNELIGNPPQFLMAFTHPIYLRSIHTNLQTGLTAHQIL